MLVVKAAYLLGKMATTPGLSFPVQFPNRQVLHRALKFKPLHGQFGGSMEKAKDSQSCPNRPAKVYALVL
jgi:hypothetical protein